VAEHEEDRNNQDFSLQISTEKRNVSFSARSNLDFFADSGANVPTCRTKSNFSTHSR
jgi:hypothetical protein